MNLTKVTPSVCREVQERIRNFFENKKMGPRETAIRSNGLNGHLNVCGTCERYFKCKEFIWKKENERG
jgi:hypothetical protein